MKTARKKARLVYIALAALLLGCILLQAPGQRYSHSALGIHLGNETAAASGESILAQEGETPAGLFTSEPRLTLAAGRYKAIVRYHATDAGGTAQVVLPKAVNSQNTLGVLLVEAPLAPGQDEVTLNFTVKDVSAPVQLQTRYGGSGILTLHGITLLSAPLAYYDTLFLALAVLGLAVWLYWALFLRKLPGEPPSLSSDTPGRPELQGSTQAQLTARLRRAAPVLFVIVLGLAASYPMLYDFIPAGHDIPFHLSRLEGIAQGLRSGQFPVRVNPVAGGGAGYAVGLMYPDIFLYPFALLRLLGVSLVGCWQALHIALNIATAALMYHSATRLFESRWAGAFAALLYTLAPYRFADLYLRAALGEALAMAFLPLAVLGLYEVFFRDKNRWPVLALGFAGVLLSHILSFVMALLFAALFALVFCRRLFGGNARLWALCKAAGLCAGLALWFVPPFLYMLGQNLVLHTMVYDLAARALYLPQLFLPPAYGLGQHALPDNTQYQPGTALVLCGVVLLAGLLFERFSARGIHAKVIRTSANAKNANAHIDIDIKTGEAPGNPLPGAGARPAPTPLQTAAGLLCFAGVALWLSSRLFPWEFLQGLGPAAGGLGFIQFPWRFVSVASLLLAFCGGALTLWLLPRRRRALVLAAALCLCLLQPAGLVTAALQSRPVLYRDQPYSFYDTAHLGTREYYYDGVDPDLMVALPGTITAEGAEGQEVTITGLRKNGAALSFEYDAPAPATLTLPLAWYPGYTATDANGQKLAPRQGATHLIELDVPAGQGGISVRYTGLWWFRIGDIASLAVAAVCLWRVLCPRLKAAKAARKAQKTQPKGGEAL